MLSMYLAAKKLAKGTSFHHLSRASSLVDKRKSSIFSINWCTNGNSPKLVNSPITNASSFHSSPSYVTPCSFSATATAKRLFSVTTTDTTASNSNDNARIAFNTGKSSNYSVKNKKRRRKPKHPSADAILPSTDLPPLTEDEYDPRYAVDQIKKASVWNQGRVPDTPYSSLPNRKFCERKWDYDFARSAVDLYERHLLYISDHLQSKGSEGYGEQITDPKILFSDIHPDANKCKETEMLVRPGYLAAAVRALTRSRLDTPILSKRVRDIERLIGSIGWTPIDNDLSYRLLEANGKAGNVRRALALLELRRRRGYEPSMKEFMLVITSIQAAQLPLRRSRNIYLHESAMPESSLDNPTRYLDAILVNMNERGVALTQYTAAAMLACYCSSGRTARAVHYFYKVVRDPIEKDGVYIPGPHPMHLGKEGLEEWKKRKREEGVGRVLVPYNEDGLVDNDDMQSKNDNELDAMKANNELKTRVRMNMKLPPPFHKVPSAVKGATLSPGRNQDQDENQQYTAKSYTKAMTKLEQELEPDWSVALTAAFAFADSLTHGACGHEPIELDLVAWNTLIKTCCYRGAFHRALKILNETLPQKGMDPDSISYTTIMAGLARVGDVTSLRELLVQMTNNFITVDKYTAQAMADGLLNVGDISGASTIIQDIFNQHDALPPYTTHLKIIEFALANGLIFEAKRHVYFIQQLWKWQPSKHHSKRFCLIMERTKRNPKLNKKALQKLFSYYGEDLNEKDFF